jgi:hypothetical protein
MSHQLDELDIDPVETQEWIDALEAVIENEGVERAHFLLEQLIDKARRSGANLPFSANTAYVNTISPQLEVHSPGDPDDGFENVTNACGNCHPGETTINFLVADYDGDGMHDSWEDSFGLDSSVDDAADNLDGDGLTNLEEYEQGYDPSDPMSQVL